MNPQYAILRFAKYKGPEIGRIEAHNERTKEQYASNPDVDTSRSHLNFHLVKPQRKYRAEAEKQIANAGCKTRKDSVRVVETLITASPEFFADKKPKEVKMFFDHALAFLASKQPKETIISAVVHVDEKTPHMHLCFVPITADGRLSAKDILGNRKNLSKWQDEFWAFMVKKYPDLERGESASQTGRTHIPPRVFKEAAHLARKKEKLIQLLSEITPLNARKKATEIEAFLTDYIPLVEKLMTRAKKANSAVKELNAEIAGLKKQVNGNKVQRYIRLTNLIPEVLHMVDSGRIALTPAVELSYLTNQEQRDLLETMQSEDCTPSLSQAQQLKQLSQAGQLDMDRIFEILGEPKANQQEKISFWVADLRKFFPKSYSAARIQETILKLLSDYQRKRQRALER